ncbi:uncharacterized protein LOC135847678 [Planococcus citri]|uniref:uncharacterized protein LOC135847678 n=1 Tax=Planococcus citri TaxID=170843 RepID=UPI0031F73779
MKKTMNWNRGILSWIFVIVTVSSINSILALGEPVGVIDWSNGDFTLAHNARFDDKKEIFVALAPRGRKILQLCSINDDPGGYKIMKTQLNEAVVDPELCEKPFVWHIFQSGAVFNIGLAIHTPGIKSNQKPKYHHIDDDFKVLGLIGFVFDESRGRTELVWYTLTPGSLLHAEISKESRESVEEFDKSINFHGYDVDKIYSQDSYPFVKVPLAPKQDFLFINYRGASQTNVLTAPMWQELYDQWQTLEIFTRRVAQVLNSLFIKVGIHGEIMQIEPSTGTKKSSPLFLNSTEGKYSIPKYFYRAITYKFFIKKEQEEVKAIQMEEEEKNMKMEQEQDIEMAEEEGSEKKKHEGEKSKEKEYIEYRYGIVIVMHNMRKNPNSEWDFENICPDDEAEIAKTGWMRFLPADGLKTPMYGCLYNKKNMERFHRKLGDDFQVFNLNDLPTLAVDPVTGKGMITNKNILEEMKRWEEASENNTSVQSNNNDETSMQLSRETIEEDLNRPTPPQYFEKDQLPRSPPEISEGDRREEKRRRHDTDANASSSS